MRSELSRLNGHSPSRSLTACANAPFARTAASLARPQDALSSVLQRFVRYAVIANNAGSQYCLFDSAPTVLRFAQNRQITKKHGQTPAVFAPAFYDLWHLRCRSAIVTILI